ncbi:MAG TPA: hypothetical protein VGD43_16475 [Micromonospora sp.]
MRTTDPTPPASPGLFNLAYHAAYHALSGRYDGGAHDTAADIAAAVVRRYRIRSPEHLRRIADESAARQAIVGTVIRLALPVPGGTEHALPLVDEAVAAAARALLDHRDRAQR